MPADQITPNLKFSIGAPAPKFTSDGPAKPPPGEGAPKRGPGRPRKEETRPATPRSVAPSGDVAKAMGTLESTYNMVALGLAVLDMQETAAAWAERAESLKATNKDALTAAPKVAKMIASAGGTGGAFTLFLTHAMAVAPVVQIGRREWEARAQRRVQEAAQRPAQPEPAQQTRPTAVPPMSPTPAQSNAPENDPTYIPALGAR